MKRIKLIRFQQNILETLGILIKDDMPIACTLELPWKDNSRNISCIPAGVYRVKKIHSEKHGDCFAISDVANREYILIHIGNTHLDIDGCILVGNEFGCLYKNNAVKNSKKTLVKLLKILPSEFELEIIERF